MDWEQKRFSQIVIISKGEAITKASENEGPYPVILGGQEPAYYIDRYNHEGEAIVISRSGASAGYTSFWNEPIFITDGYLVEPTEGNHRKYIYYLLKHFRKALRDLQNGAAIPHVTPKTINKLKAPIPPLNVQKRVAGVLSAYDNLIEVNNKRIKVLEQMAENLYKEWFVRFRFPGHETAEFENGIPKGWKYCSLGSIAIVEMGQSPESQYYNYEANGLPFHQGVGSYGELYLVDDMYSTDGKRIAEPNSIIFSVRAPVGRINITLNRIIMGRGIASINSIDEHNGFLFWMLKNKFVDDDLIGNGAIFSSVKKDELLKQKFLIPSRSLEARFDQIAKQLEKQIRVIYYSNKNLLRQRDLLLPRLMSGKLEV